MKNILHITSIVLACSSILLVTLSNAHVYDMLGIHRANSKSRAGSTEATLATVRDDAKKAPNDTHLHTHIDKVSLKNVSAGMHADPRHLRKYLHFDQQSEISLLD